MREATQAERALGCRDRGLLGGFSGAVLRYLQADPKRAGKTRSWAMAALTSYGLKNTGDREEVCLRLATALPDEPSAIAPEARLDRSVLDLPGVGEKMGARLEAMGLRTVGDLLDHVPRTYLDRRHLLRIADLRVGQEATVLAKVREAKVERTRRGKRFVRATISDETGHLTCIFWGQEWRARQLTKGTEGAFSGELQSFRGRLQMTNPAYDLLTEGAETVHTARVVPVYPATEQVSAPWLRRLLHRVFEDLGEIPDPVPAGLRAERNLLPKDLAYRLIHFPDDPEEVHDARRRLVFEELFTLQVGLALRKRYIESVVRGIVHDDTALADGLLETLPFAPTGDQERVMAEITKDMAESRPMHRLLQGEVGSGKSLVAMHAALVAVGSGSQAAIMAPTEVLAEQLARTVRGLLEPVGVEVGLLTSSVPAALRRDTLMRLGAGDLKVVCGTHALLTEDVAFHRLGLAVVDEQHRFGLAQRMVLREKGTDPDVLIMTATPIPRTMALTIYGDLDVSVIHELPEGRKPIATHLATTGTERESAYRLVRDEVAAGRRAFVVCALVDESDALEAKAATEEAERLRTEVFPGLEVGLLHGQMPSKEKERVMRAFRDGEVSVLIATTVIEVGVDVPEATVMLIEDADRFGISQLHQLRGRVGRGEHGGTCILFSDAGGEDARRRLEAVAATNDGFELAEEDLRIRGEGTIFGTRQAGMTDLRLARLVDDLDRVVEAREAAFVLVEADPKLAAAGHRLLRSEVSRRFGDALDWLFHG